MSLIDVIPYRWRYNMKIQTTANIEYSVYEKIIEASSDSGIPVKKLVHVIFRILIAEKPLPAEFFSTVKYQRRPEGVKWKCFHLELDEAVYESAIDMRKLMKRSVSFLLDLGVGIYLDRALREIDEGVVADNYPNVYFIFIHHSPKTSTYTAFHTVPFPSDYPNHFKHPD
jgi:hypothetical protein